MTTRGIYRLGAECYIATSGADAMAQALAVLGVWRRLEIRVPILGSAT